VTRPGVRLITFWEVLRMDVGGHRCGF